MKYSLYQEVTFLGLNFETPAPCIIYSLHDQSWSSSQYHANYNDTLVIFAYKLASIFRGILRHVIAIKINSYINISKAFQIEENTKPLQWLVECRELCICISSNNIYNIDFLIYFQIAQNINQCSRFDELLQFDNIRLMLQISEQECNLLLKYY